MTTLGMVPRWSMRAIASALFAFAIAATTLPAVSGGVSLVSVIATSSSQRAAERAVARVGGSVSSRVPLVNGVVARVPADRLPELSRLVEVAADRTLRVRSASFDGDPTTAFPNEVGAVDAWARSSGEGVGVALVDTGVAPVADLVDRVAAVADLTPERAPTDTFGHGTFMAGLVAGDGTSSGGRYVGVAPGAHLVSIKVAVSDGSTTLGTVLNGLQLVHHVRARFNIRVLLLALSSGSTKAPERDPLTRALRELWDAGIFVVVPAGNDGPDDGSLDSPGVDPVLVTAGAVDDRGTPAVADDVVPDWTSRGPTHWNASKPDVAAPGVHLVSVRAPGSTIDGENPSARVEQAYFRGSGTSMSAALVAGVAALMLSREPRLTPDGLKQALLAGATPLTGAPATAVGAGVVNANAGTDTGHDGSGPGTARRSKPRGRWGGHWDGRVWDGRVWDGRVWDGRLWDSRIWDGRIWDGRVWDGRLWDGRVWDGRVWNSRVWNSRVWG